MPLFLSACDIIIMNDSLTNFNLTFAETLMMGRPCMVRDAGIGVIPSKIKDCSNLLIHDGTELGIKRALDEARNANEEIEFSMVEHLLAKEYFSESAIRKISMVYQNSASSR